MGVANQSRTDPAAPLSSEFRCAAPLKEGLGSLIIQAEVPGPSSTHWPLSRSTLAQARSRRQVANAPRWPIPASFWGDSSSIRVSLRNTFPHHDTHLFHATPTDRKALLQSLGFGYINFHRDSCLVVTNPTGTHERRSSADASCLLYPLDKFEKHTTMWIVNWCK